MPRDLKASGKLEDAVRKASEQTYLEVSTLQNDGCKPRERLWVVAYWCRKAAESERRKGERSRLPDTRRRTPRHSPPPRSPLPTGNILQGSGEEDGQGGAVGMDLVLGRNIGANSRLEIPIRSAPGGANLGSVQAMIVKPGEVSVGMDVLRFRPAPRQIARPFVPPQGKAGRCKLEHKGSA